MGQGNSSEDDCGLASHSESENDVSRDSVMGRLGSNETALTDFLDFLSFFPSS